MSEPKPFTFTITLPPKAALLFLAACGMDDQTPELFALKALGSVVGGHFGAPGLQDDVESFFEADESGEEEA